MNVGIIFPRFIGPYGGERLVLNEAKELSKLDNKVTLYTRVIENNSIQTLPSGTSIVQGIGFKTRSHELNALIDLLLAHILITKIKKEHDLVIVVGWQAAFAGGIIKIFNGKKKIVYRCLEPPRFLYDLKKESKSNLSFFSKVFLHILSPLIKSIDYSSVKKCDAVISISKRTKNQVKEIYGIDSEVVEPGIETERFKKYSKEEARKKLKINRGAKIYLSVSKLHKRKRIDLAIEYFKKNRTKGKTVFFIIGDGPEKENLEKIRGGFKDIIFLGRLEDKLVDLYLSAADYFIFTAKNEPFGIAPLEAKLAGCKIVPKDSTNKIQSWEETAKQLNRIYTRVVNENRHYS